MSSKPFDWLFEDGNPMDWRTVAITMLAVALPPVIAVLIYGRMGAVAFIAALPAYLAAKDAGVLNSSVVTLVMGMAGLLALGDPDMALIVAPCLGIITGICGKSGMARPCLRALITWTVFTSPILPADEKPMLFAIFILAMIWSLLVAAWFDQTRTSGDEDRESDEYALIFGSLFAFGLAASVFVGGRFFGEHGFWFPLTFVVLCIPPHGRLFKRTVKRTVGTILGTAVAIGFAWISEDTWLLITLGAVSLALSFRTLPWNYTVFTACLTVSVLEVLALVSDISTLAFERLYTMAAAAVMTFALGALGVLGLWLLKPDALKVLQQDDDAATDADQQDDDAATDGEQQDDDDGDTADQPS
ncbi:FUSC family protein [Maribius pontilimi]|uniref:FUSC family protein n=1 Tax=Palleronia pontilimi TaxID=1964209 RepID=A0A934I780_9RHOB|nr:FUSC family protein [Palleronia pontilimi]MBJ3761513.1 FUSC family protein [Palleronia pontilimi]